MLKQLGTCSLGPRRHATLLRVGSRVVLVGVSDSAVRSLGEWDATVLESSGPGSGGPGTPAGGDDAPPPSLPGPVSRFARLLSRGGGAAVVMLMALVLLPAAVAAQGITINIAAPDSWPQGRLSTALEIFVVVTALTFLPALVLTATCFTRFIVVFHFVRQALGIPETPPNQVLVGLSLFLTAFVMAPVGTRVWNEGIQPHRDGQIGWEEALEKSAVPLQEFMLRNTREPDLALIYRMAKEPAPLTRAEVKLRHLLPAYVISELTTAFTAGFLIFLPFLVIDVLVASVLLSMGMMMMPPVMVSMPLKVMVFVMAGGWNMLVASFVAGVR